MNYLLLLLVSLGWSIYPFIVKKLLVYFSYIEVIILSFLSYIILVSLFTLVNTNYIKNFVKKLKKVEIKYLGYILLLVSISVATKLSFFDLLKNNNVSKIIPIIRAISAVLLVAFGYFIFNEKITIKLCIGVALIVLGIYLVN